MIDDSCKKILVAQRVSLLEDTTGNTTNKNFEGGSHCKTPDATRSNIKQRANSKELRICLNKTGSELEDCNRLQQGFRGRFHLHLVRKESCSSQSGMCDARVR